MGLRPHYKLVLRKGNYSMKCADPVLCYTQSNIGKRKFRHFSLASDLFKSVHNQVFNCGKCIFCRKKKSFELAVRCVLHASLYDQNCFLTLTYDEKKEGYHNDFNYKDIQDFKKRLRSHAKYHDNKKIEIFNVHEYGKNGKKHWHLVVFNYDFKDKELHTTNKNIPLYTSQTLSELWPFGFNTIGDVSEGSAMYQAQYTQKDIKNGNSNNSRKSHSKHSGIGKPYFLRHFEQILTLGFIPFGGRKLPLPRAFEKIAHKHYSHYYEPSNFFDQIDRKALYRPFKQGLENKKIADLFIQYKNNKILFIEELTKDWDNVIEQHLTTKNKPDFLISAENALYDMQNKNKSEKF